MAKRSRRDFLQSAALAGLPGPSQSGPAPRGIAQLPDQRSRTCRSRPGGSPTTCTSSKTPATSTSSATARLRADRFRLGQGPRSPARARVSRTSTGFCTRTTTAISARATARRRSGNIPIAVPAHEYHLFADAENFWRNRRVFHLYYVRNDFNTITENIPVAPALADYSTFRWKNTDFFVLPTPGHTLGSITLLATIDGRKTAFSGDLMYSAGQDPEPLRHADQLRRLGRHRPRHLLAGRLARAEAAVALSLARRAHRRPGRGHRHRPRQADGLLPLPDRRRAGRRHPALPGQPPPGRPSPDDLVLLRHHQRQRQGHVHRLRLGVRPHFGSFERATAVTDRIRFVEHTIASCSGPTA